MVEFDHGTAAPLQIAGMIGAAAVAGDPDAIAKWKALAVRFDQLLPTGSGVPGPI